MARYENCDSVAHGVHTRESDRVFSGRAPARREKFLVVKETCRGRRIIVNNSTTRWRYPPTAPRSTLPHGEPP